MNTTLRNFVDNGHDRWDNLAQLSADQLRALQDQADHLAIQCGMVSRYLEYRGAAGCGDHGHDAALAQAMRARKKIRRALGYAMP